MAEPEQYTLDTGWGGGIAWLEEADETKILYADDVFEEGKNYIFRCQLTYVGDHRFATNMISASVNGMEAEILPEYVTTSVVRFQVHFTCRAERTPLTAVSMKITAPEAGKVPFFYAETDEEEPHYFLNARTDEEGWIDGVRWSYMEGSEQCFLTGKDIFLGETDYKVELLLAPCEGYCFLPGTAVEALLNQENASFEVKDENLILSRTFRTGSAEVKLHTLTFLSNTEAEETMIDYAYSGVPYYLPECTFTAPEGYAFDYWEVSAYDEGGFIQTGVILPGDPILFYQKDQRVEIKAIWAEKNANGVWISGLLPAYEYTGKAVLPDFRLWYGDTLLTLNKDYAFTCSNNIKASSVSGKDASIKITLKGNYSGKLNDSFTIIPLDLSMIPEDSQYGLIIAKPSAPVKSNRRGAVTQQLKPEIRYLDQKLSLNKDYTLSYDDDGEGKEGTPYQSKGQWSITIQGKGNFTGETKTSQLLFTAGDAVNLKDAVLSLDKSTCSLLDTFPELTVKLKDGTTLQEGTDYKRKLLAPPSLKAGSRLSYLIDWVPGGRCCGSKSISFKYVPHSLTKEETQIQADTAVYSKSGAKPDVEVLFRDITLTEGMNYTLSFKNNGSVDKKGICVVKGIGPDFTGSISKEFDIKKQDLANLYFEAANIQESKKASAWKNVPVFLWDEEGFDLKKNKDYTLEFSLENGDPVPAIPEKGTKILVKAIGKGNYEGEIETSFYVVDSANSLKSAKVTWFENTEDAGMELPVKGYTYTGEPIVPERFAVTVGSGKKLQRLEEDQYRVLRCTKNTDAGTATLILAGSGENSWAGAKAFSFKIFPVKAK